MTTQTHSNPIPAPVQVLPREPRPTRHRRLLLAFLRAGGHVYTSWGNRWMVYSPRSARLYQVCRWVDGATVRWECTCEHAARHGTFEQYNLGTSQARHNAVWQCAHVTCARLAAMPAGKRADLLATDGELRVAWNSAHGGEMAA